MSDASLRIAGIILVVVPTIEFGGWSLLRFLTRNEPGYLDNPLRRAFFTAGHAHAGVWVILALVGLLSVDGADLSDGAKTVVRDSLGLAAIVTPSGFFLSIASPRATRPNGFVVLIYLGAALLAVGTVTLGVGLLRAT